MQSVGYPNPNRSHFESEAIWYTGMLEPEANAPGWLNRGDGRRTEATAGDSTAIHVGNGELAGPLRGDAVSVPTLDGLDQLVRRLGMPDGSGASAHRAALDRVATLPRGEPGSHLEFVQRSQVVSYASSARIEQILRSDQGQSAAQYPFSELGRRLRLVAQLIKSGLSTSVYYVQLDGFDTHADQLQAHGRSCPSLATPYRRSSETSAPRVKRVVSCSWFSPSLAAG